MVRITDALKDAKNAFSLEFLPAQRYNKNDIEGFHDRVDQLMSFGPLFVTNTFHQKTREEIGRTKDDTRDEITYRYVKSRCGPDFISAFMQGKYPTTPVAPHFICGGFSQHETEDALVQLPFADIENVIALRGDPNDGTRFVPHPQGHDHATGLVKQIAAMRDCKYVNPEMREMPCIDFCIGVAGYPEAHESAPNIETDIRYARMKQGFGADFIITQMCFDVDAILRYRDLAEKHGITMPIVPGIKVLVNTRQLEGEEGIPHNFGVRIPPALYDSMQSGNAKDGGGIWAADMAERLWKEGFPCVHFYTNNRYETIAPVLRAIGFSEKSS
jgi:methylenetetrahydrofolate reductase (NADPH)